MTKKASKKIEDVVEEVKEEGVAVEIVTETKKDLNDFVERREPSGKLVRVYKDGRVEPVR
jgi:histidinol phosphatase-like PHP family hydrolase